MSSHAAVSHRRLAHHTIWNVAGYVLPLIVAVFALPPLVARLGADRYGLLSLVLVVHDYLGYFDFGLGRATTRFMAAALHDDTQRESIGRVFWTCVVFHVGLGILAGIGCTLVLPFLTGHVLSIPLDVRDEGRLALYAAAWLAPALLLMIAARGALEAAQRFDLVNLVRVPSNALTYLLPLAGVIIGLRLPAIVMVLVGARLAVALVYLALCLREFPEARRWGFDWGLRRPLFSFGGWIMVTNLAGMLLVDGDRFLIGAIASVGALTYYSVPQDVGTRLWIIPASVASALFPMFSLTGSRPETPAGRLYADSTLYLLILFVPIVAMVEIFGGPLLTLWMGADFAARATLVLQIVTLGVFLDALARVPLTYLQAAGYPAIPAKIRLALTPVYLAFAAWGIHQAGIAGAAVAWTARIVVETAILFGVTGGRRLITIPAEAASRLKRGVLVSGLVLGLSVVLAWFLDLSLPVAAGAVLTLLAGYGWYAWSVLLDSGHRLKLAEILARERTA